MYACRMLLAMTAAAGVIPGCLNPAHRYDASRLLSAPSGLRQVTIVAKGIE